MLFGVFNSHTVCVSGVIKMNTTCTIIKMRNILLGNKINKTYIEMPGQTELKQCDYMIQGDHEAHRPWNITASTPNAIVNYLCWAQFSLRFWHFWWVSSLFQWLSTIRKPVLSISLIVRRLYIRISLTTRENTLVARDGEGFVEVAMLLHVLMFWGLLARPAGRSDWPAENYPVRTSRVMRKAGAARRRLAEKLSPILLLIKLSSTLWHQSKGADILQTAFQMHFHE